MKLFNKIFLLFAASCFLVVACDDEEFTPGPTIDGQGFFFSSDLGSSYTLQMTDSSFELSLNRTFSGSAATATITSSVTDAEGDDASSMFGIPSSVSFDSNALSSTFEVTFDAEEIGYETYSFVMDIDDNTTPYGRASYEFTVSIEAVWKSLGKGFFYDKFFFEKEYEVEIQQNDYYKDRYRLVTPYDDGLVAEYGGKGTPVGDNKYFTFRVLKSGETLAGVTVADSDLVYYDPYDTGAYYSDETDDVEAGDGEEEEENGSNIWVEHPADFPDIATSVWANNKVVSYADDGTPGVVQLAPNYYMPDYVDKQKGVTGVGFDHTEDYGCVVITFPSQVPGDYKVEVSYSGKYVDANDNGYVLADVTITGADVVSARVALVATDSAAAAYDAVVNGTVSYEEVTADGQVMLPYSESGNYTLIVVAFDKTGAQDYDSVVVKITSGSVSWVSLGNCEYTDDFFTTFWNNTPLTYEVEIQECEEFPGLYRLVYPYDGKYAHNDPGDWDDTKTYYLEVDATDPDCVWIDKQAIGVDWYNGGMMYVWSYAGYYMSEGYAADSEMVSQYYGSLVDGVITFPTDALLFCRGINYVDGDKVGAFYTANTYGSFQVVLPDAVDRTSVKTTTSSSKKSIDKTAGTGSASLFVPVKFRGNLR